MAAKKPTPKKPTVKPLTGKKTPMPKIITKAPPKKTPMPKKPAMPTKRPMVGNDKEFNKKYGSKSWNNGYTN